MPKPRFLTIFFLVFGLLTETVISPKTSLASIVVDGDPSDWVDISPILQDAREGFPFPDNGGWDILKVSVTNDADHVFFLFEFDPSSISSQLDDGFLVDLDTDQNPSTGCVKNIGDVFGSFSTIGTEALLLSLPYNQAFGSTINDFRSCGGIRIDFPGALQVAASGAFVEVAISLEALKFLTPNLTGFDMVVRSGGDVTNKGSYTL